MSYMKSAGTSAKGNDRLLKQYGGNDGSSPMARQHYATGGAVKSANPSLNEGLSAAGAPAKKSLARPGRKMPGKGKSKGKEAKTNINVIIAGGKPEAPAMPPPPMDGPPMPPPGAGGPPPAGMPMRAKGGRVCKEDGGRISEDSKTEAAKLREESKDAKTSSLGSTVLGGLSAIGRATLKGAPKPLKWVANTAIGANAGAAGLGVKRAGRLEAEANRIEKGQVKDGEEDRKHGGSVKRAEGGPVMGLSNKDGGAGGASGRLAKIKDYGK